MNYKKGDIIFWHKDHEIMYIDLITEFIENDYIEYDSLDKTHYGSKERLNLQDELGMPHFCAFHWED